VKRENVNFICKRITEGAFARRVSRNATPFLKPGCGENDKTSPLNQGAGFMKSDKTNTGMRKKK
jgi:hypothetical protein